MITSSGKKSMLSRNKKNWFRRRELRIMFIFAIFVLLGISRREKKSPVRNNNTFVVLKTSYGPIHIKLLPHFSKDSVDYITSMMVHSEEKCSPCNFYRSEKGLLLQGVMEKKKVPLQIQQGPCPNIYKDNYNDNKDIDLEKCPMSDARFPYCDCHGPIMTRGMVGWAAGETGPDFFINMYHEPANWWGNDHTVWGEIEDSKSFAVIDRIAQLPLDTDTNDDITYLKSPLHFDVEFPTLQHIL